MRESAVVEPVDIDAALLPTFPTALAQLQITEGAVHLGQSVAVGELASAIQALVPIE